MTTVVTNTIGVGGDYSTPQSWEDASPPNLVTIDQVWVGELVSSFTHTASTTFVTFSGTTCDATRYKELTVQSGLSFQDNPSKLTNALTYVPENGLYFNATGISSNNNIFSIYDRYVRINRLQINYGSGLQGSVFRDQSSTYTNLVEDLIIQYFGDNIVLREIAVEDSVVIVVGMAAQGVFYSASNALIKVDNVTIVRGDGGSVSNGVFFGSGTNFSVRWSAFFGFSTLQSAIPTFSECASDATTLPSGVSRVPYDTTTGSGFYSITSPYDFRIRETSALIDAATDGMAHDIVGTLRPQGDSYDIGCWEYSTGGGGSVDHATEGDVVGNTAEVTGSADLTEPATFHQASGVLTGQLGAVAGTANRFRAHDSSGSVANTTHAAVTGAAELINPVYIHETEGVLTGAASVVTGEARRFRAHATEGTLVPTDSQGDPTAKVVGSAEVASPAGVHECYGALTGQRGTVTGAAKLLKKHVTTGALVGKTAVVMGGATKFSEHDTSGIVVGYDAKVVGSAVNVGTMTLTPADIAAIVAALKAEILPVNIVRVNGDNVDGDGSDSNPWGPV